MLNALRERLADYRRERRIRALRLAVDRAHRNHDAERMKAIARDLFAECDQRSEAQKQRMERAVLRCMDPHARAIYERGEQP